MAKFTQIFLGYLGLAAMTFAAIITPSILFFGIGQVTMIAYTVAVVGAVLAVVMAYIIGYIFSP